MIFVASELLDWAKDDRSWWGLQQVPSIFKKKMHLLTRFCASSSFPSHNLEHPARRITGLIEACFPSTWEVLLWVPPVPVCGCCLGGFLSLGNGLRVGNSGFYGYWASWDLQLVFQRQSGNNVGSEHRGTWKQLEGPGRWAPFQPFSGNADLRSPPFEEAATWSMRFQGVAPPTGCVRYRELYKS